MESIIEFSKNEYFPIILLGICILLLILYIITLITSIKTKNNYKKFLNKIGNGTNIQESIENYMKEINKVQQENNEIKKHCKEVDNSIAKCIQKIGIIRYNAFKDTGSNLSFALALLDEENTGIVLNGIYSREMSNIYAKPIQKGESIYTLSEEEKQAVKKAIEVE